MSKGSRDRTKDHEAYRDNWSKVFENREHIDRSQHVMREILPDGSVREWINFEEVRDDDGNIVDIRVLSANFDPSLKHLDDVFTHGGKDQDEPTGLMAYWDNNKTKED